MDMLTVHHRRHVGRNKLALPGQHLTLMVLVLVLMTPGCS